MAHPAPVEAKDEALNMDEFEDFGDGDYNDGEHAPLTGSAGNLPTASSSGGSSRHCWQLGYYQTYFNIEEQDVVARLKCALMAYRGTTIFDTHTEPDLYGPFWIPATVSLTLFVVSNIAGFVSAWLRSGDEEGTPWVYDFGVLASSFSTMLSYVVGAPTVLWLALKWLGQPCRVVDLICIYGYSGAIWLPMTLMCIVPISWLRWIIVLVAFAYSSYFLFKNIQLHLQLPLQPDYALPKDKITQLCALAIVGHMSFGLVFKFVFFQELRSSIPAQS